MRRRSWQPSWWHCLVHGGPEFFLVVNIQVPGSTTYSLALYFMMKTPSEETPHGLVSNGSNGSFLCSFILQSCCCSMSSRWHRQFVARANLKQQIMEAFINQLFH